MLITNFSMFFIAVSRGPDVMFCEVEAILNNGTRRIKRTLCYEENKQHVGYVNLKANEMKASVNCIIIKVRIELNRHLKCCPI